MDYDAWLGAASTRRTRRDATTTTTTTMRAVSTNVKVSTAATVVGGRSTSGNRVEKTMRRPIASSRSSTGRRCEKTIAYASSNGATVDLNDAPETFWGKMKAAYRIFFPPSAEETARQEAKKRLRMILVADRCAMSETSMDEMKRKIVEAVGEFVDLDETQDVDVSMNTDVELGTMYAVSIPVRRVKAEYDAENDAYMVGAQFVGDGDEDFNYDDSVWEN